MDTAQKTEYSLHLVHYSLNGTERWKAVVEAFPEIIAEGPTCERVLEEIGEKLHSSLSLANLESAVTPVTGPGSRADGMSPSELAELEARLNAMGHSGYGVFADDPGALEVFDEIEQLRDQHTIGGG